MWEGVFNLQRPCGTFGKHPEVEADDVLWLKQEALAERREKKVTWASCHLPGPKPTHQLSVHSSNTASKMLLRQSPLLAACWAVGGDLLGIMTPIFHPKRNFSKPSNALHTAARPLFAAQWSADPVANTALMPVTLATPAASQR